MYAVRAHNLIVKYFTFRKKIKYYIWKDLYKTRY